MSVLDVVRILRTTKQADAAAQAAEAAKVARVAEQTKKAQSVQRIQVGNEVIEFPASMKDEEIKAVLKKNYPPKPAAAPATIGMPSQQPVVQQISGNFKNKFLDEESGTVIEPIVKLETPKGNWLKNYSKTLLLLLATFFVIRLILLPLAFQIQALLTLLWIGILAGLVEGLRLLLSRPQQPTASSPQTRQKSRDR